ncbi:TPR end-of-group domain-containing protein [Brumimicrobium aurantiacum]|uniref:Tetratricopeptide repeat protein n=1 Tax=Brumimicrobium aurantiacum TaxID=1737063 RepID=A0A3E1F0M6_9FLAO|nr:hypothetical protein [Brumimicrobium aurantiacum]RFC55371.1 hypothetical protein DXU93_00075 [Brumimicrobium aurantiacum]
MKNKGIKSIAFVAAAGLMATSCDLIKDVEYVVKPSPLELHGDSVRVKIDVNVPEKGINKKAYAEIVPMLGTHPLKPVTIVGENATANGAVVPYKPGGKVVYEDVIAYTPDLEVADLTLTGTVYKKGKEKGFIDTLKVADATVITPLLVEKDFRVILAADEFQRVTKEEQIAEINYLKGSPVVRSSEKSDEDIKELEAFMAAAQSNPKIKINGIKIEAFASIEGEEDKNNTLSQDRSNSAKEVAMELAAKKKVANEAGQDDSNYTTIGKGEDFKGFKRALKASDMDKGDKDRILRILEMQQTPEAREQAIRDLSTYLYLDNNIFPAQRRSEIIVDYDLTGYSDEELTALSKSNIDTLNVEEILFTATLTDDLNEKLRLYKEAERLYPEDYRPSNNVGSVYYMQGKLAEAKTQFEKANNIEENEISKNNLAAIAGTNDERQKAKDLLSEASGAGSEVSYNQGVLNIQDGKYDEAIANFGSEDTFNKALAQLLNKDDSGAKTTIDASAKAETAKGYYLKAIIAARQDNIQEVLTNLEEAIKLDSTLKSKADRDREFINYEENPGFIALVK